MNLKKSFLPITTFVPIDVRRLFRDKVAIFFVFVFPIIFLVVFGGIFGGNDEVSFKVGILNNSKSNIAGQLVEQAEKTSVLDIDKEITNMDEARAKMNRSEISSLIILPKSFGELPERKVANVKPTGQIKVLYDQNNEQAGQTLKAVLEEMLKPVNKELVDTSVPFTVKAESTATQGQTRFDYTFAGLLGFSLLSLGIFGPTTVFPRLKEKGVLRRYHTTTLKVWQYFVANVISNAFVGLLSVASMFIIAIVVFDLNMRGDYFSFAAVVLLGASLLFGIGLAVGGWAKNENQAAPLAQLVTFPMMFLSGVFFPTFLMPEWLQSITKFIPLTPIIDSIRFVVTEGKTIFDLGPQLLIVGAWIIVIYIIAFRVFRWE
jgi:ABC-2 type transport system permease protein